MKKFTIKKGPKYEDTMQKAIGGITRVFFAPYDPSGLRLSVLSDQWLAEAAIECLPDFFGTDHSDERVCVIEDNSMTDENRWFYYTRMGRIFPTKRMIRELLPLGKNDE